MAELLRNNQDNQAGIRAASGSGFFESYSGVDLPADPVRGGGFQRPPQAGDCLPPRPRTLVYLVEAL